MDDLKNLGSFQLVAQEIAGGLIGALCAGVVCAWLVVDVIGRLFL